MTIPDLTTLVTDAALARLRDAYSSGSLIGANVGAVGGLYLRLAPWSELIGSLYYETSPLAARDRELALIAVLAQLAPGLALGNHIYWGLMEDLTIVQICEVIGLTGCYCGLPAYIQGMLTLRRTLTTLSLIAAEDDRSPGRVLSALVVEFEGPRL